jgi:hypothetical protein
MSGRAIATCVSVALALSTVSPLPAAPSQNAFTQRGYYITLMRMPVMGLPEWKQAVDCFAEDDINTLILWTAGGFRSQKFPITWKYNADHANIQHDFVRDLIDYCHTKHIRVLLGFTPFGYDGTNQYPLEHPELKANKPDGTPVDPFGIHSIGWNLCPAQPESQRFMREYIHEMFFDFYPNADGLLIESSDYAICHCPQCGPLFYDHEFDFVRAISNEVWQQKPEATILVFPHYFTGAKVPGLDATAARQPFDPRWGLSFAAHSAPFDADLMKRAKVTVSWSDATALHTPREVAAAARTARDHHASGFIPSLEAFSYIPTTPEAGEHYVVGKRHAPYGFDATAEGKMPYNLLPARVQRFAYCCYSQNPDLSDADFKNRVAQHFFPSENETQAAELATNLLELQRIWSVDSDWYWPSPLLDPDFFQAHWRRLKSPPDKLAEYDKNLVMLSNIAAKHAKTENPIAQEMSRLAKIVLNRWDKCAATPSQLTTGQ